MLSNARAMGFPQHNGLGTRIYYKLLMLTMVLPLRRKIRRPAFLFSYRFWLHLTGWLAFFASPLILPVPISKQLPAYYVNYLFTARVTINLLLIGVFYLNLFRLTPRLLFTKNAFEFFGYLALIFLFIVGLDYLFLLGVKADLETYFANIGNRSPFPANVPEDAFAILPQIFANFVLFTLIVLSSSFWALLSDRLRQQQFSQQMLYEKTSAELAAMRLQISPHFLFNTLNNIRWLARIKSDQAETSIMELSEILRYMLRQVGHQKVALRDEVIYLTRYINLQRLRINSKAEVDFVCGGHYDHIKIEPLLFIAFVENAFKFGIHADYDSKIAICLVVEGDELLFSCVNTCFHFTHDEFEHGHGLGLVNVKRRLELYYPQTHVLTIRQDEDRFYVTLKLKLRNEQNSMSGR